MEEEPLANVAGGNHMRKQSTPNVEALKDEVLQNVSLKVGKMRNQVMTFSVNQVWRTFMNLSRR